MKLVHLIDKTLYKDGFTKPELRVLLRAQLLVVLVAAIISLGACWVTSWPLIFTAGAAIATLNFYWMAKFVRQVTQFTYHRSLLVGLLVRFYGRLALTGILLFVLILWLRVPVIPLLMGLSTLVGTIVIWGAAQSVEHKAKEA
jgi:hypothetical protein